MNDKNIEKQKRYNLVKWGLGITGVILILISLVINDSNTEKILEWIGFGAVWGAVIMKFLDPALETKHRDTPDNK